MIDVWYILLLMFLEHYLDVNTYATRLLYKFIFTFSPKM